MTFYMPWLDKTYMYSNYYITFTKTFYIPYTHGTIFTFIIKNTNSLVPS